MSNEDPVVSVATTIGRACVVHYLERNGFAHVYSSASPSSPVSDVYALPSNHSDTVAVPVNWTGCDKRYRTLSIVEIGLALDKTEIDVLYGICHEGKRST